MSQFVCWNCGLRQGDEGTPELPSQLCESCKAVRASCGRLPEPADAYSVEDDGGES